MTHTQDGKKTLVHVKLNRTTLPEDGQQIKFQTQNEDWHEGYFIGGDDLFWVNDETFYPAFDIVSWEGYVKESKSIQEIAIEYAERVCNGQFPITYTREQVVKHTADDFIAGTNFLNLF
jgi:hypothetical protein